VAKVNAVGKVLRSEDDCRKKWRDLKSAVVHEQADKRKTGGGPPMKATAGIYMDLVMRIIGDEIIIHGIEGW